MKKISSLVLILVLLVAGCNSPEMPAELDNVINTSQDSGYVDTLTTDADGFVRFPGEPTRQTTKYVVVEDICGQFTAQFMENMTGHQIAKAENPYQDVGSVYSCHYTYEGSSQPDILLILNYLTFANQKKGHEVLGRRTEESSFIPMRNLVVYQDNGQINEIYLVLSDNKYISINRGAGTKVTNEELLAIAAELGQKMANYQ